jgi:hypothetical protein
MTSPNNSALLAGLEDFDDFDDLDVPAPDEPTPSAAQPPQEAPQEPPPKYLTKPQDALDRATRMPPQLVEKIADNAELLRPVARGMAAINLHNLFVRIQHPNTNNKDRLDFQSMLNKLSGLDAKEAPQSAGAGFSITINIPGSDKGLTVEGSAERIVGSDE